MFNVFSIQLEQTLHWIEREVGVNAAARLVMDGWMMERLIPQQGFQTFTDWVLMKARRKCEDSHKVRFEVLE